MCPSYTPLVFQITFTCWVLIKKKTKNTKNNNNKNQNKQLSRWEKEEGFSNVAWFSDDHFIPEMIISFQKLGLDKMPPRSMKHLFIFRKN